MSPHSPPCRASGLLTMHMRQYGTEIQIDALDERGAMVVLRSAIIGARATARNAVRRTATVVRQVS